MTTLIEDLQALLNPLVVGGSHFGVNETEPPVYPYIVFSEVASTDNVSLQGPSDLQNTRIQIDVFSLLVSEMDAKEKAVRAALQASALGNLPRTSQYMYEAPVKAHRKSLDYSVWAKN